MINAHIVLASIFAQKITSSDRDLYVVMNSKIEKLLDAAGALCNWKEQHPGAVVICKTVCGLPYCVHDSVDKYKVMSREEFQKWHESIY